MSSGSEDCSFLSQGPSLIEREKETGISSFSLTTPKGTKIEIKTLEDVLNSVPEERQWVVEGILPESGLAILGGRHKRGKSTLLIQLCKSVALGEPFLDRATQQGLIVYINYEMPSDYFASLCRAGPTPERFVTIDRPETRLKVDTVIAIIKAMKKRGFERGVLTIDSFRGAFKLSAEKENQSGEAGLVLRQLQEIAVREGWLILVVHHHKKSADGEGSDNLSGTGDFGAAPDVIWSWSRPSDPSKPGKLEIEGRIVPVEPFIVSLSPEKCVCLGEGQEGKEQNEQQRILQAMNGQHLPGKEIAEKSGVPYSTTMKRLETLRRMGKVDKRRGDGRGPLLLWYKTTGKVVVLPNREVNG